MKINVQKYKIVRNKEWIYTLNVRHPSHSFEHILNLKFRNWFWFISTSRNTNGLINGLHLFYFFKYRAVAEINHLLHYQSEVGVNTYVTIHISFLLGNEKRRTKVVARTFCPEFDHYSEFPCNLIIQKSNGESFSLAELLDSSEAVFTIYHQSNKAGGLWFFIYLCLLSACVAVSHHLRTSHYFWIPSHVKNTYSCTDI